MVENDLAFQWCCNFDRALWLTQRDITIRTRPASVEDRAVERHSEGDLLMGESHPAAER